MKYCLIQQTIKYKIIIKENNILESNKYIKIFK